MKKDVRFQVECLTRDLVVMLMEERHCDMRTAMDLLYHSQTFESLQDESTGLYYQGAVYVFSCLKDEFSSKP